MRPTTTVLRWATGAACLVGLVAIAAPAQADPRWDRGRGHPHRWGPPPHRYYPPPVRYYPPPVYYAPPPAYYAPPPMYYAPPPPIYRAPGFSFGLNIPLR